VGNYVGKVTVKKADHDSVLQQLLEFNKHIFAKTEIVETLDLATDYLVELTGAERGLIILFGTDRPVYFETARNLKKEEIEQPEFEVSRTIIAAVKASGDPIFLRNAVEDPQFEKSASVARLKILSVICLPLKRKNEIFGVIYLDNRSVRGAFRPSDYEFATRFTEFISLAAYNAMERKLIINHSNKLEEELRTSYAFDAIIGHSPEMLRVLQMTSQVADTDVPVLLQGETGTGKELVARAIHFNSNRKEMPLICVNCAAFPENLLESEFFGHEKGAFTGAYKRHKGKFEQADGGTIFLDEVDEMSQALQVKLLRILQWGEFNPLGSDETKQCDVRIVAASKQNLQGMVNGKKFRDDLYYRLNLVQIELPPLRERKGDILILSQYFLKNESGRQWKSPPRISQVVQNLLNAYPFPGNVRELESIIRRAAILCNGDVIRREHLPTEQQWDESLRVNANASLQPFQDAKSAAIARFEKTYLENALKAAHGVIREAAKISGMYEANFHIKLKKYNIQADHFKGLQPSTKAKT
jgi:Nif-specific regulatory protein